MPIISASVGRQGERVNDVVEDRWLSNYAAAVYDSNDAYFDNRNGSPAVHPAYASHLEWDAIEALQERLELTADEQRQGLHSFNHTILQDASSGARFSSGDTLTSRAELVGVEQRRSGGRLTIRIETTAGDVPVATSFTQTVFVGVPVEGDDVVPDLPARPDARDLAVASERTEVLPIGALASFHFSECARDYGAIHTDRREAELAGIPDLILHGTATFAYALSSVTNHEAAGDPRRVREFGGDLKAMLSCPSEATILATCIGGTVHVEVLNDRRERALARGFVRLAD